jgi:hypothetical protein
MTAKNKIIIIKFVLSCFFILDSQLSFSQDLIIKLDSSKIFCEITQEDSATIYYKALKGDALFKLSINKSEVLKYYNSKAIVQSQIRKADSIAKANPKPAFKSDSIFFKERVKFTYHNQRYGNHSILKIIKNNPESLAEMKKAIRNNLFNIFSTTVAITSLASFAADAIAEGKPQWALVGAGIGFYALSFAFNYFYHKHTYKAVSIYNSKLKIAGETIQKFEIGMVSRGVGICFKF